MINLSAIQIKNDNSWDRACPFPVGYVYMSSNSTSPANIYGGTWSSLSGGRYLRANSSWGDGGSNTITVNQMPAHTHYPSRRAFVYCRNGEGTNLLPAVGDAFASYGYLVDTNRDSGITPSQSTGGATVLSNVPRRVRLDKNCLTLVVSADGLG